MRHERYKVYNNSGDDSMDKIRYKIEQILNDPNNEEYEIDKFELAVCGSSWPYKFILILKHVGSKPKNREIS